MEITINEEKLKYAEKKDNPWVDPALAGKESGDVKFTVCLDGKIKGKIYFFKLSKKYLVESDSILGEYKGRWYKTFTSAKKFLINSKPKYMSLSEIIRIANL